MISREGNTFLSVNLPPPHFRFSDYYLPSYLSQMRHTASHMYVNVLYAIHIDQGWPR